MDIDIKIREKLKQLPDVPGIYLFYNKNKEIIYVGKAGSLKNRVKSYFVGNRQPRPIETMIFEVKYLEIKPTDSVLEAIILEGDVIKRLQPKYNVLWKDDKSWIYIMISKDEYPRLEFVREHDLKKISDLNRFKYIFGPYPGLRVQALVKILRRLFLLSFCQPNSRRACLYRQMGDCLGVCTGEISVNEYQKKVIMPLITFLSGKKKTLIRQLEKEMKIEAGNNNFESAARLRDRLKAIKTIRDVSLMNQDFIKERFKTKMNIRFEGYDISNLGPTNKVGSMVVFDYDGPVKNQYRKFNIINVSGVNDVACLREMLLRRIKREDWPWPDVVVIDGGRPQINQAIKIFKMSNLPMPVIIGIAKGPKRIKNEFILGVKNTATQKIIDNYQSLVIQIRDESHRFAISFQRKKRKLSNYYENS